jgi:tetratricopeptide (TPR) repeat protein
MGLYAEAITSYLNALDLAPKEAERWRIEETIGNLYIQMGDLAQASGHYQSAFELAPDAQKERLQTLIDQINPP